MLRSSFSLRRLQRSLIRGYNPLYTMRFTIATKKENFFDKQIMEHAENNDLDAAFRVVTEDIWRYGKGLRVTDKTISLLIDACSKTKQTERAFEFFHRIQTEEGFDIGIETINAMIEVCIQAKKQSRIGLLVKLMNDKKLTPTQTTHHRMIQLYTELGDKEKTLEYINKIKEAGFEPSVVTYNIIIKGYMKSGDLQNAVRTFEQLVHDRIVPNEDTFCLLISGASAAQGFRLLGEMKRFEVTPTVKIYNAFMNACGREGNLEKVAQVFEILLENNLTPDRMTFNTILATTIKAKAFQDTLKYYEIMQKTGIKPNLTTYNILVSRAFHLKDQDGMSNLFGEMTAAGYSPDVKTVNMMMSICLKNEDYDTAMRFIKYMKDEGIEPDETTHKYMNKILKKVKETKQGEEDVKRKRKREVDMEEMEEDDGGYSRSKFRELEEKEIEERNESIFVMCESLSLEHGKDSITLKENATPIPEKGTEEREQYEATGYQLIVYLSANGEVDKAFQVADILREQGVEFSSEFYCALISGLGKANKTDRLPDILDMMELDKCGFNVDIYNEVIGAFGDNGEVIEALDVLEEMKEDDILPNEDTYLNLLWAAVSSDIPKEEEDIIHHIVGIVKNSGFADTEGIINLLMVAYDRLDDREKVFETYRTLKVHKFAANEEGIGALLSSIMKSPDSAMVHSIFPSIQNDVENLPEGPLKDSILTMMETFLEDAQE